MLLQGVGIPISTILMATTAYCDPVYNRNGCGLDGNLHTLPESHVSTLMNICCHQSPLAYYNDAVINSLDHDPLSS